MLWFFLPGIILLGLITSYTDLKHGKIRNKHILLGLIYGIIMYAFLIIKYYPSIRVAYITELLIMLCLSLFSGFLIWIAGLWTAGDAKLFFTYSLLVPMSVYQYGYVPYFSSVTLLVNTLVPLFLFFIVYLLFKTSSGRKWLYLKRSFEPRILFGFFLFLFAFTWPLGILFSIMGLGSNYFLMVFFLFIILITLERFKISFMRAVVILAVIRLIFDHSVYSLSSMLYLLYLLAFIVIIRLFILYLGFYFFTKDVDIKLLKEGMVPAEVIYKENDGYKKQDFMHFDLLGYLMMKRKDYLINITSKGLTNGDIEKLKKAGLEHLKIQSTVSFAHFLFIGVLLTIIFKGDILFLLRFIF